MSFAYHLQTDGQTERVNQCLETFLRCFVHACPKKWKDWLALAEFWYNTSLHSTLGRSPFEVLYGQKPRHFGISDLSAHPTGDLIEWLKDRETMTKLIQQHLARAQNRMKKQANKQRLDRTFQVSDMVFLKLQPYVQSSVATRANHKLAFNYFGPYRNLEKVGVVAYKLDLPASSMIHPVFHVSQLKAWVPRKITVTDSLPTDMGPVQFPLQVLARRIISQGGSMISQVKVCWSGLSHDQPGKMRKP